MLKYQAAVGMRTLERVPVNLDAAAARLQVTSEGSKECRLPATGWAQEANKLARLNRDRYVLHGLKRMLSVPQPDVQVFDIYLSVFGRGWAGTRQTHHFFSSKACHGIIALPSFFTSALLPMPSNPISAMPTTISA